MKTIKIVLLTGLIFSLNGWAMDANTTIGHLQYAMKALNSNELEIAEEHMKMARQTVKDIIGGSLEVKAQRGSGLITQARRQAQSGDAVAAAATLRQALEIFEGIHDASKSGRGGL